MARRKKKTFISLEGEVEEEGWEYEGWMGGEGVERGGGEGERHLYHIMFIPI